jgi:hypothetical protein
VGGVHRRHLAAGARVRLVSNADALWVTLFGAALICFGSWLATKLK